MFCRMFALQAGTVPIALNVDVPDRALIAAFLSPGRHLPPLPGGSGDDPGGTSGRNPGGDRLRH